MFEIIGFNKGMFWKEYFEPFNLQPMRIERNVLEGIF
jgi:hypothetical protein